MASLSLSLSLSGARGTFEVSRAERPTHAFMAILWRNFFFHRAQGASQPPRPPGPPNMLWGFEGVVKIAGVYVLVANMLYCMEVKVLSPGFV